jgi:hypothetical protein
LITRRSHRGGIYRSRGGFWRYTLAGTPEMAVSWLQGSQPFLLTRTLR